MTQSEKNTNENKVPAEEADDKPSIPLRWVFYLILGYAVFQTLFFCYQVYFHE